jgi:hypothetical protein
MWSPHIILVLSLLPLNNVVVGKGTREPAARAVHGGRCPTDEDRPRAGAPPVRAACKGWARPVRSAYGEELLQRGHSFGHGQWGPPAGDKGGGFDMARYGASHILISPSVSLQIAGNQSHPAPTMAAEPLDQDKLSIRKGRNWNGVGLAPKFKDKSAIGGHDWSTQLGLCVLIMGLAHDELGS